MQTIEKHVDPISHDDLLELAASEGALHISIYVPTERVWNESKKNPMRLKNLLRQAEDQLTGRGLRDAEIDGLLAPARDLLDRSQFWQHQSDGLALFLREGFARIYRLPLAFEEQIVVSESFHVRPLLRYTDGDGRFYVLTLTQGGVNLYRCTRHSAEQVPLEDVPTSLPEAMQYDDLEAQLRFHPGSAPNNGGRPSAIFHGQGDAADRANVKEQIMRFFRTLDNGVRNALNAEPTRPPLVLAGLDYLRGLYGEANQYASTTEDGVDGNPSDWDLATLHRRAWDLMAPHFASRRQQAFSDYGMLAASEPERVAAEVEEVVPAAYYQRIDTLFVPEGGHLWGTFDTDQGTVHYDEETAAELDLLDLAVAHTLINSGTVYLVDPVDVPDDAAVAAILRY